MNSNSMIHGRTLRAELSGAVVAELLMAMLFTCTTYFNLYETHTRSYGSLFVTVMLCDACRIIRGDDRDN